MTKRTTSHHFSLLALLFLLSPALSAGEVTLEGRVFGPDGDAAAMAEVFALPAPGFAPAAEPLLDGRPIPEPVATTRTAEDGTWRLEVEPGLFEIRVLARGAGPVARSIGPVFEDRVLPDCRLRRARVLEIPIRSSAGEPVVGAWLTGTDGSVTLHRRDWRPPRHVVRSDDRGRFRLVVDADEENLVVAALHPEHGEIAAVRSWGPAGLRFPETSPRVIEVVDDSGTPVAGATIVGASSGLPWGRTDDDGRLVVRVTAAGTEVRAERSGGLVVQRRIGPAEKPGSEPAMLRLPAPSFHHGRVVAEGTGLPIADALVWLAARPSDLRRTDSHGRFRVPVGPDLLEGLDVVQAAAPGRLSVIARIARTEDRTPEETVVELPPAAEVDIRVVDRRGDPLAGVRVRGEVIGSPSGGTASAGPVTARTGAEGGARLHPLPPAGTLRLLLSRPDLERRQEEFGLPLPRDRSEIVVRLGAGRRLVGRVLEPSRDAAAGARVDLEPHHVPIVPGHRRAVPSPLDRSVVTDAEGVFEIPGVSDGRWTLRIRHRGAAPLEIPGLRIAEADGETLDFGPLALEPEAIVEGRVVDDEGRSVPGAEVGVGPAQRAGNPAHFRYGMEGRTISGPDGAFRLGQRREDEQVDVGAFAAGFAPAVVHALELPLDEPVQIRLERTATVSGRVVDSRGRGVPDARLGLRLSGANADGSSWSTGSGLGSTLPDGTFTAEGLRPGSIRLLASSEGFVTASVDLELVPGEHRRNVELELRPGATLSGRVVDGNGRPVAEAWVTGQAPGASLHGGSEARGVTDSRGRFRLTGLEPGTLSLEARAANRSSTHEEVDLRPGDNEVELVLSSGHPIRGRVVDADGLPAAGARVTAASREHGGGLSAVADPDGRFELAGARLGSWLLRAEHPEAGRGSLHVAVDGPTEGVRVELGPGIRLHGRILGADVEDLADAFLRADSFGVGESHVATIDREGRWEIEGAGPGTWSLRGDVGGHQLATEIRVEAGDVEAIHDFDLSEGLTLDGWVHVDGEPVAGAHVRFFDARGGRAQPSTRTDDDGRFRLAGLSEGRIRLWIQGAGVAAERRLHLEDDEFVEIEASRSRIAGRVVDGDTGEALEGAGVRWEPTEGSARESYWAATFRSPQQGGRFLFEGVPEGRIRFVASAAGYESAETTIPVTTGTDIDDLLLELLPSQDLLLRVLEPAPPTIRVSVDGPGGGRTVVAVEPDGLARVGLGSAGLRTLRVAADGRGTVELPVELPTAEPLPVALPPAAPLVVETGREGDSGTEVGYLTIFRDDGRRFVSPRHGGIVGSRELPLSGGLVRIDDLSPGTWTLQLHRLDGTKETATVVTRAGEVTRFRFD